MEIHLIVSGDEGDGASSRRSMLPFLKNRIIIADLKDKPEVYFSNYSIITLFQSVHMIPLKWIVDGGLLFIVNPPDWVMGRKPFEFPVLFIDKVMAVNMFSTKTVIKDYNLQPVYKLYANYMLYQKIYKCRKKITPLPVGFIINYGKGLVCALPISNRDDLMELKEVPEARKLEMIRSTSDYLRDVYKGVIKSEYPESVQKLITNKKKE